MQSCNTFEKQHRQHFKLGKLAQNMCAKIAKKGAKKNLQIAKKFLKNCKKAAKIVQKRSKYLQVFKIKKKNAQL